jgi:NAD-dependent dihydropyrimidine dehydrogenase PreA subunit
MVLAAVSNTLRYSPDLCINCGMCVIVCPHGVFAEGDQAVALAAPESCMECGACQRNCPTEAIQVESGVGCAAAMIQAALRGRPLDEAACGDDCCEETAPAAGTPASSEPAECG